MTSVNNKDMTVKALLKVTQLESYLKQKQYLSVSDKGMIFQ